MRPEEGRFGSASDNYLKPLRHDPRYLTLLRRLKLPPPALELRR